MEDQQFRVASRCELLPYLINLPLGLSRKRAKDLLRFRAVKVPGKPRVHHDTLLEPGDIVAIALRKQVSDAALEHDGLRIVYLDNAIVVVDKPPGLLSIGSEREKERTAHRILNEHLKTLTKSKLQQAFIVHRLDRETSGLMLFARNESTQEALQLNWKNAPMAAEGTLSDRLVESKSFRVHRIQNGGELAITHYRVIRRHADKSLLELTLETGRKHQIRVQLAAAGHPIIGDRKYGASNDSQRRLALHSCELTFRHPVTRAPMEFRSALPGSLRPLIEGRRVQHEITSTGREGSGDR
jgi:23S rRNA pseudouridine1911/1915/1917 synthase